MNAWPPRRYFSVAVLLGAWMNGIAVETPPAYEWNSSQLHIRLEPRTPNQMAAFYEARGFGQTMIDILRAQCYITVLIENRSRDILWLDLAQWRFANADGEIPRPDRNYWKARWQAMDIPLAHQSTFRWTLLPEQLDFRPGEREGGNIVLPRLGKPMRIHARFARGKDREGAPIDVAFDAVICAENPE